MRETTGQVSGSWRATTYSRRSTSFSRPPRRRTHSRSQPAGLRLAETASRNTARMRLRSLRSRYRPARPTAFRPPQADVRRQLNQESASGQPQGAFLFVQAERLDGFAGQWAAAKRRRIHGGAHVCDRFVGGRLGGPRARCGKMPTGLSALFESELCARSSVD